MAASTASESILYNFVQFPLGVTPTNLIADAAGNLYGTAIDDQNLVVFRLSKGTTGQWTQTILQTLLNGNGPQTYGGLVLDKAGNLYGTTLTGGIFSCGTVFRLSPTSSGPWSATTLYTFACYPDAAQPSGPLIFDSLGNLYGVTNLGGNGNCSTPPPFVSNFGCGTVFELSPQAGGGYGETILYSFGPSGPDVNPRGVIAFDAAGNLYGETPQTVFELTPGGRGWSESVIENEGCLDSSQQCGVVLDPAGNIYTVTSVLNEEAFTHAIIDLSPKPGGAWTETTLYTWPSGTTSSGALVLDPAGNLYGGSTGAEGICTTTYVCGIFELSKASSGWSATTLYSFTGGAPISLLRNSAGQLYTTTLTVNAATPTKASVFELSRTSKGVWEGSALYLFPTGGANPLGGCSPTAPETTTAQRTKAATCRREVQAATGATTATPSGVALSFNCRRPRRVGKKQYSIALRAYPIRTMEAAHRGTWLGTTWEISTERRWAEVSTATDIHLTGAALSISSRPTPMARGRRGFSIDSVAARQMDGLRAMESYLMEPATFTVRPRSAGPTITAQYLCSNRRRRETTRSP